MKFNEMKRRFSCSNFDSVAEVVACEPCPVALKAWSNGIVGFTAQ
jgi:hypothetical protein